MLDPGLATRVTASLRGSQTGLAPVGLGHPNLPSAQTSVFGYPQICLRTLIMHTCRASAQIGLRLAGCLAAWLLGPFCRSEAKPQKPEKLLGGCLACRAFLVFSFRQLKWKWLVLAKSTFLRNRC